MQKDTSESENILSILTQTKIPTDLVSDYSSWEFYILKNIYIGFK